MKGQGQGICHAEASLEKTSHVTTQSNQIHQDCAKEGHAHTQCPSQTPDMATSRVQAQFQGKGKGMHVHKSGSVEEGSKSTGQCSLEKDRSTHQVQKEVSITSTTIERIETEGRTKGSNSESEEESNPSDTMKQIQEEK